MINEQMGSSECQWLVVQAQQSLAAIRLRELLHTWEVSTGLSHDPAWSTFSLVTTSSSDDQIILKSLLGLSALLLLPLLNDCKCSIPGILERHLDYVSGREDGGKKKGATFDFLAKVSMLDVSRFGYEVENRAHTEHVCVKIGMLRCASSVRRVVRRLESAKKHTEKERKSGSTQLNSPDSRDLLKGLQGWLSTSSFKLWLKI